MGADAEPWPWLMAGLALLLVGLATAFEVVFTTVSRGDVRKLTAHNDQRPLLVDTILGEVTRLSTTILLLKSAGLMAAGAVSAQILLNGLNTQHLLGVCAIWVGLVWTQMAIRVLMAQRASKIILPLAPLVWSFLLLCWPLTSLLQSILAWLLPRRWTKGSSETDLADHEDLHQLISTSEEDHLLEDSEKQMIVSILELEETVVREVMVPRIDMVTLDVETSLQEALNVIIDAGHSRIPVYKAYVDQIVGILYAKDLLKCFRDQQTDVPLSALLRRAYFIPVSKKANTLLKEMQKERVHIAMVVDEYGGTAGLVTIEDLIEEIIGEIQDEYDSEADVFVESIGTNVYVLNSRLDLYSLSKLLDIELPDEDADTLGGLIYSLLGHVPEQGEAAEYAGWRFTVLSLDGKRIDQVRAEPIAALDAAASDTQGLPAASALQNQAGSNALYNLQSSD